MIQIRTGIFETNSSSTHSLTMCSKSDYEKWVNGELFYNLCDDKFIDFNEGEEKRKNYISRNFEKYECGSEEEFMEDYLDEFADECPLTFQEYNNWLQLTTYEDFKEEFNNVVAFGYYNNDY